MVVVITAIDGVDAVDKNGKVIITPAPNSKLGGVNVLGTKFAYP